MDYYWKFQSLLEGGGTRNSALMRKAPTMPKPQWHPPWKLFRVSTHHFPSVFFSFVDICETPMLKSGLMRSVLSDRSSVVTSAG